MAGPIRIAILANGRQARREISQTSGALGRLSRVAKSGLAVGGVSSITYGLFRLGKAAVGAESEFSTSMRLIQASTKAPEAAMDRLNDLAIKLGNDTQFSAGEAADAMLELAKAGINTNTILKGGLAGTLQLAAAGGTDLATASTIASNALNTFSLRGQDMASIAAALAGGANASTASVESLGTALSQVGPGAVNAGLSLQETVAALAAFDAAGIKGSDAGTSLKTMLARLVPQTAKASEAMKKLRLDFTDSDGNFLQLADIAQQLQDRLGKLTPEARTAALAVVFGSDATRAATVLMKEGAKGVEAYTKATRDQSAAEKMAAARMNGTAGALERLSGAGETALLRIGQELAPTVEKVADGLSDNMGPALEDAIAGAKDLVTEVTPAVLALKDLAESGLEVGRELGGPAFTALKELAGVALDAVALIGDLPDPIKDLGIQAGIAALVLPRLSGAVTATTGAITGNIARLQQWRAEMTYTETRAQNLTAVTGRLGAAARTAAGIGGMLALANSADTSSTALNSLGNIAGGALLGFSIGGPWGAAIGAGVGGLKSLWDITRKSSEAMEAAEQKAAEYASAIERIAAASGKAQRAEALGLLQKEQGLIPAANSLGVSTSTLISALLGSGKAYARVNAAVSKTDQMTVAHSSTLATVTSFLREQGFALRLAEQDYRDNQAAIKGNNQAASETPKRIRQVNAALAEAGRAKPNGSWERLFFMGLDTVRRRAGIRVADTNRQLEKTGNAKPDLGPFERLFYGKLDSIESGARTGGRDIGSALGAGVQSGLAGTIGAIGAAARAVVANAIAAAKDEADSRSPSRKMMRLGNDMGDGLALGLQARRSQVESASRSLSRAATVAASYEAGRPRVASLPISPQGRRVERVIDRRLPSTITLIVDGRPIRAIVREEIVDNESFAEAIR